MNVNQYTHTHLRKTDRLSYAYAVQAENMYNHSKSRSRSHITYQDKNDNAPAMKREGIGIKFGCT